MRSYLNLGGKTIKKCLGCLIPTVLGFFTSCFKGGFLHYNYSVCSGQHWEKEQKIRTLSRVYQFIFPGPPAEDIGFSGSATYEQPAFPHVPPFLAFSKNYN